MALVIFVDPDGTITVTIPDVVGLEDALDAKLNANDPSVDNARTPTAHKASHAGGGSDELTPSDIGAATSAQGDLADSALQAEDIGTAVQAHSAVLDATTASFTTSDETKLDGIASGAEQNVQSDWDATSGDAQILNKPALGTAAAEDATDFATAAQGGLADSALQSDDIGVSVQAHSAVLDATTASFTTADETKLDGVASGAEVNVPADWNAVSGDAAIANKPVLSDVATSGDGADVVVDLTDYVGMGVTADNAQDGIHDAFAGLVTLGGSVDDLNTRVGDVEDGLEDANIGIGLVSDGAAAADEFILDLALHGIQQAASRIPQSAKFSLAAVPAQTITAANRIGAGLHTWPDGNIGFASISGTIYAFAPNGPDSARNTATPTSLRGTVQQTALALTTLEPADYAGGGDIYNTGTRLIKLWHGEAHDADPTRFISFHGLATATTAAPDTWTDMGRIITADVGVDPAVAQNDTANNSMVVFGSYMYVFFSEKTPATSSGPATRGSFSVARALLADVVTWAGGGAPVTFSKFYRGAWTEPGIGGKSSEIIPGAPYPSWASAIRVSGLADRFIMAWTAKLSPIGIEGNQWGVYVAMSEPGSVTEWGEPELLLGPTPSAELTYITLADSTDLSTHVSDATTMKMYLVSSALGAVAGNRWTDAEVLVYDLSVYSGKVTSTGGTSQWYASIPDTNPVTYFGSIFGAGGVGFGPANGAPDIIFLRGANGILVQQFGSGIQIPKLTSPAAASAPAGPNILGDIAVISGVLHECVTAGSPGTWEKLNTAAVGSWVTPTLTNSWVNVAGTTRYRRIGLNEVEIDLQALMSGASGSSAFNLPAGFRPSADEVFYVYTTADGSDLGQGQVTVKTTGNVEIGYPGAKPVVTGRIRMFTV